MSPGGGGLYGWTFHTVSYTIFVETRQDAIGSLILRESAYGLWGKSDKWKKQLHPDNYK